MVLFEGLNEAEILQQNDVKYRSQSSLFLTCILKYQWKNPDIRSSISLCHKIEWYILKEHSKVAKPQNLLPLTAVPYGGLTSRIPVGYVSFF